MLRPKWICNVHNVNRETRKRYLKNIIFFNSGDLWRIRNEYSGWLPRDFKNLLSLFNYATPTTWNVDHAAVKSSICLRFSFPLTVNSFVNLFLLHATHAFCRLELLSCEMRLIATEQRGTSCLTDPTSTRHLQGGIYKREHEHYCQLLWIGQVVTAV